MSRFGGGPLCLRAVHSRWWGTRLTPPRARRAAPLQRKSVFAARGSRARPREAGRATSLPRPVNGTMQSSIREGRRPRTTRSLRYLAWGNLVPSQRKRTVGGYCGISHLNFKPYSRPCFCTCERAVEVKPLALTSGSLSQEAIVTFRDKFAVVQIIPLDKGRSMGGTSCQPLSVLRRTSQGPLGA
jgi:hypothetical protein